MNAPRRSEVSSKLTSPTDRVSLIPSLHQKWKTLHNSTPSSWALHHPPFSYWSYYGNMFEIKVLCVSTHNNPQTPSLLLHSAFPCLIYSFVCLSMKEGGAGWTTLREPGICTIQTHALYTMKILISRNIICVKELFSTCWSYRYYASVAACETP